MRGGCLRSSGVMIVPHSCSHAAAYDGVVKCKLGHNGLAPCGATILPQTYTPSKCQCIYHIVSMLLVPKLL